MTEAISVNQAVENLAILVGQDISIKGILCFEFENISINHYPNIERKDGYNSSIWLLTGAGSLNFDQKVCEKLHGSRIIIQGTLLNPDPEIGAGHMGLWPAEFLARILERE
jgi:hypothetical protein